MCSIRYCRLIPPAVAGGIRLETNLWPRDEVPSQLGKVWYLTVQEGWVEGGASQRRAGLHVDSPGRVNIGNWEEEEEEGGMEGRGVSQLFEGHRYGSYSTSAGHSCC